MSRVVNSEGDAARDGSGPSPSASRRAAPLPRVLCVDDETTVLALLARALHSRFEVVTTDDPEAALGLLAQGNFSVVSSDMWMPRMSGTVFLERVKQLAPDATRLALTGCLDSQLPADIAFGILTKPFPLTLLHETVTAAAQ